jgi:quinol monooxygenase YgiN
VCVDPNDDTKVFLYEIYDDHAAFEAHLRTAHFAVFDKSVEPWVASKSARKLTRMFP